MNTLTKKDYRELVRYELRGISAEDRRRFSKNISEQYMALDQYKDSMDIFIFSSFDDEVSTEEIINNSLRKGKRVYLPRIRTKISEGSHMDFFEIKELSELKPGHYHLLEPAGTEPVIAGASGRKVEMVVPGVCYDLSGKRIGHGGGYYDRYLKSIDRQYVHCTSLAFDVQLVSAFQNGILDPWDQPVDLIVSERRIISLIRD